MVVHSEQAVTDQCNRFIYCLKEKSQSVEFKNSEPAMVGLSNHEADIHGK